MVATCRNMATIKDWYVSQKHFHGKKIRKQISFEYKFHFHEKISQKIINWEEKVYLLFEKSGHCGGEFLLVNVLYTHRRHSRNMIKFELLTNNHQNHQEYKWKLIFVNLLGLLIIFKRKINS